MSAKIIGLTGGIGTGKTTIAKVFECLDVPVYFSDDRAKELYLLPELKARIISLLGNGAYNDSGSLNREFISSQVFVDSVKLEKLNAIIHPAVKEDFKSWQSKYFKKNFVIKESALLFETGLYKECDHTILVTSPMELRINRIQQRDQKGREEVMRRINAQWPEEKKIPLCSFLIRNDEMDSVIEQVLAIYKELIKG